MAEYSKLKRNIGTRIGSRIIQLLIGAKTEYRFYDLYGDFHFGLSFRKKNIEGLKQESGKIHGSIVFFLEKYQHEYNSLLLAGEGEEVKPVYEKLLKLKSEQIDTAGVMENMDYYWDFEDSIPMNKSYSCIISQSMIEHLIDPFKHIKDLSTLLEPEGVLILHTVMPGFDYHRYPIDCFRFYPDWFEEVSKRFELKILDKYIRNSRISYIFQKQAS